MKKRKILSTILAFVLVAALILPVTLTRTEAVSQADIDALKEEKEALNSEKEDLQETISSLTDEHASVIEKKAALDQQNELARQEIEIISEQIDIYDQIIENKQAELEEAETEEAEQMESLRSRMRAMEEQGTVSYMAILFEATSFSDLLSRIDMVREIMERDNELEANCIDAREHLEEVKADYETTLADQEIAKAELLEKKAQLEADIEAACQLILDLEDDIEAYEAFYAEKEAREAEIDEDIRELLAELDAQQKAAEEAGKTGNITGTGTYIWPLPGYSPGSAYGWRLHPILGVMKFHAGEDIGAPSGTPILAADSGIAYPASNPGGYGNYVLINHGDGRSTLYGHMTSYCVSYGQSVNQGDVIGYVGSTGLSTGPHLHFEVRVNGNTTDPKSYFNF